MESLAHMVVTDDWQLIAHRADKENVADLIDLYDRLNDCYSTYEACISAYTTCPAASTLLPEKSVLIDFYDSPPTELGKLLRDRRNDHALDCCPYCGSPKKPNELDHFIPKSDWPEFSIYPNNLVPQCRDCASLKWKHYYCNQTHAAFFIHPIYTDLLPKVFFSVDINFIDDITPPTFTPGFALESTSPQEIARIEKHLAKLQIPARFAQYCSEQFISWKNLRRRSSFTIQSAMTQRITEKSPDGVSAQDWETAFCFAVLANPAVVDFFNRIQCRAKAISAPTARVVLNV
ncbi:HNH endonuclease [Pseudomonas glycinae]|uniref:HNH endonuclease n=1 Tax=Pseudomonas glycinae TaxID=1785145 RepID=UPI0018D9C09F|nr:HNH endonuclease [Pseudomonas glycinae]MBH3404350.1 HNH endonuclease [Pseudomonas glycinae]